MRPKKCILHPIYHQFTTLTPPNYVSTHTHRLKRHMKTFHKQFTSHTDRYNCCKTPVSLPQSGKQKAGFSPRITNKMMFYCIYVFSSNYFSWTPATSAWMCLKRPFRRLFVTDFIWICFSVNRTETLHEWIWTLAKRETEEQIMGGKKKEENQTDGETHHLCCLDHSCSESRREQSGSWQCRLALHLDCPTQWQWLQRFLLLTHKDQTSETTWLADGYVKIFPQRRETLQIWYKSTDMMFFLTPRVDFIVCLVS